MRWDPWFICLPMPLFEKAAIAQLIWTCCDLHLGESTKKRKLNREKQTKQNKEEIFACTLTTLPKPHTGSSLAYDNAASPQNHLNVFSVHWCILYVWKREIIFCSVSVLSSWAAVDSSELQDKIMQISYVGGVLVVTHDLCSRATWCVNSLALCVYVCVCACTVSMHMCVGVCVCVKGEIIYFAGSDAAHWSLRAPTHTQLLIDTKEAVCLQEDTNTHTNININIC